MAPKIKGDVFLEENIMFEAAMGYIQSSVILKCHVQNKQLLDKYLLFITSTRKIRVTWKYLVMNLTHHAPITINDILDY